MIVCVKSVLKNLPKKSFDQKVSYSYLKSKYTGAGVKIFAWLWEARTYQLVLAYLVAVTFIIPPTE